MFWLGVAAGVVGVVVLFAAWSGWAAYEIARPENWE